MTFAVGRRAYFICDQCGFQCPYKDQLHSSYGTVVCPTCYDGAYDLRNHPQNFPPKSLNDPIAIRYPRADVNVAVSTTVSTTWGIFDGRSY